MKFPARIISYIHGALSWLYSWEKINEKQGPGPRGSGWEYHCLTCGKQTDAQTKGDDPKLTHSGLTHWYGGYALLVSEKPRFQAILGPVLVTVEHWWLFWMNDAHLPGTLNDMFNFSGRHFYWAFELLIRWWRGMFLQPSLKFLAKFVLGKGLPEAKEFSTEKSMFNGIVLRK